jgi:hypothetical protein
MNASRTTQESKTVTLEGSLSPDSAMKFIRDFVEFADAHISPKGVATCGVDVLKDVVHVVINM